MSEKRKVGKNVKSLVALKVAAYLIDTSVVGFIDSHAFYADRVLFAKVTRQSLEWSFQAIDAIKSASDNPHGNDDETIAQVILDNFESLTNIKAAGTKDLGLSTISNEDD